MGEIFLSEKDAGLIGAVYNLRPYIIEQVDPETHEPIKTPYCYKCGNLANGLMVDYFEFHQFFRPICKSHFCEKMDKENYQYLSHGKIIAHHVRHANHQNLLRENL